MSADGRTATPGEDDAMSGQRHHEVRNGRCSVCRYTQGGEASWFHCPRNPDGYKKESP